MKRTIRYSINIIFILAVLTFGIAYTKSLEWERLSTIAINLGYLALSVFVGVLYLCLATYIWIRMLWRLNPEVKPSWDLYAVYAKSWMGRYIPGKVVWIAGKIHFASNYGIPASQLGITSLLEAGVQMATQLVISLIIVLVDGNFHVLPDSIRWLVLTAIIGMIVALIPPIFNSVLSLGLRLLRRRTDNNIKVTWMALGEMAGLYSLGYLLLGATYFLTLKAIIPDLDSGLIAFTTAGISIAGTLGILALFAPSGLGVREGFIVVFLAMVMPVELAVVAAVVLRFSALFVDLVFLAFCVVGRWVSTGSHTISRLENR